ncbi:MAG: HDOD domain-containing protein [Desulfobacteraceae bacterium]|nr:HDOD domain-containing protein [Desulfobacteraceae bacterium]
MDEALTPSPKYKEAEEAHLDRMLDRIRHSHEFPGVSKYIAAINQKLSADPESFHASELADMILKDYGLSSKLLRLANSVAYGFTTGKVTTISRAVVILGYVYVRLIAISLILFEHFKSKNQMADLKEEMIRSLWSGMLARDIAIKERDIDSEEAFVCAMLIRLGKLMTIRYFPDEYQKILRKMRDGGNSEAKAVKAVYGTSYEALGQAVARQWNFPARICEVLQPPSDADLGYKDATILKLRAITSFINELAAEIADHDPSGGEPPFQALLNRHRSTIHLTKRQLQALIKSSVTILDQHAHAMDFDTTRSPFFRNLRSIFQPDLPLRKPGDAKLPEDASLRSYQLGNETALQSGLAEQPILRSLDMLMDGIQEISRAMLAEQNLDQIAAMSVEILYRSLGFQRALMFMCDDACRTMNAEVGFGKQSRALLRKLAFKIATAGDLFTQAIQSGKDLIVSDAHAQEMNHLIPKWYRDRIDAPAFIFLPVMAKTKIVGALYADRDTKGQPISKVEHRHLDMLRNQLALALRYS